MRAHEAGALHGNDASPTWLPYPDDVNALIPGLWSRQTAREESGQMSFGGVPARDLLAKHGSPLLVVDEADFRSRAREFKNEFAAAFAPLNGASIFYAGKAFLCTSVVRWVREEGLNLDVCTGGELAVAKAAAMPGAQIAFHGNNKSDQEIRAALEYGVGRLVIDSLEEIDRVADIAAALGVRAPVMLRVTAGVEAHTHEFIATAHEDQKFGLSLTGGVADEAVRLVLERSELNLLGVHSHIGSQIFDVGGFEIAARRVIDLLVRVREEHGVVLPELDLGGGFGVMYNTQHAPKTPAELAPLLAEIVREQCGDFPYPHLSFEPGRAIVGPAGTTLYTVGTVKNVQVSGAHKRLYVSVDGGMSDNIRTALYDADYSCLLASRTSPVDPAVVRIVGKHCESGDIVVKDEYLPADVHRGDIVAVPVTGAYCYSLASNYNHVPRPAVVSVGQGESRLMVRRESEADLLALDAGVSESVREAR
ncbi:diaminopimelate decarboxylase [Dermabacteraceae bacterium P13088]